MRSTEFLASFHHTMSELAVFICQNITCPPSSLLITYPYHRNLASCRFFYHLSLVSFRVRSTEFLTSFHHTTSELAVLIIDMSKYNMPVVKWCPSLEYCSNVGRLLSSQNTFREDNQIVDVYQTFLKFGMQTK